MALTRKLTAKIYEIQAHSQKVTSLDIGETGRVLVTGGQDRNVNLWAFGNEKCFMSLPGHNGQVDCVKFTSGDDLVYSADENGIIKRWDLNTQPGCVTFYGHMKSVRTLDFHPHGNYIFASGSNDTTVRLWDVRKSDSCFSKFRGHIANVNSVKFSPDGWWIASAGTEGSVIIWDIRTTNKVMEFQETASPVTCITFHPSDFILAAGRNDGTVDLYDLETKSTISRADGNGHTVKCITFGENGECCFVGSAEGVSVNGWEPDREFDHIESAWSMLGDMKVVKQKLICGSYEKQSVLVHAINLDHVIPYYNPTNIPFKHNQSTRKSFNRGTPKTKLVLKSNGNNNNDFRSGSLTSGKEMSSPSSLSFEMIEESIDEIPLPQPTATKNEYAFENLARTRESSLFSLPGDNYNGFMDDYQTPMPPDNGSYFDNSSNDLDYYPERSVEPEREDFPVNSAQQPDYAPKKDTMHGSSAYNPPKVMNKSKLAPSQRRTLSQQSARASLAASKKFSTSNIDLHSLDDNGSTFGGSKKSISSRNGSPTRNYSAFNNNNNNNHKVKRPEPKEINHARNNRKITVQILAKPPPPARSKTSLDLKSSSSMSQTSLPMASSSHLHATLPSMPPAVTAQPKAFGSSSYNGHGSAEENAEISVLTAYHERVYQQLSTRYATLQLVRNSMRSQDIGGAIRHVAKMQDHSVMVDLLGAIIEKPASWNLDMCATILPEIYELLQSEHKFHYTRACDTLRIILSNFLPIIQSNTGPWARSFGGGVDIPREERQKKCMEAAHWLCKIKTLPDNRHMGSNLTQLQNLIVEI
ncbi:katanin p80 WD40 repeat-containing subunit B1 [Sitodiplosis mosellana]|uniref:katanin p80 WD40 repeat-containing subunit B1 n=1 Tax=Sitodiplosis mosellana TaxID=263140 RepID=UPI002444E824|nr:katanin p80 WD40 repeat-containing subunit B1 [Sitodiplosis mosellana]